MKEAPETVRHRDSWQGPGTEPRPLEVSSARHVMPPLPPDHLLLCHFGATAAATAGLRSWRGTEGAALSFAIFEAAEYCRDRSGKPPAPRSPPDVARIDPCQPAPSPPPPTTPAQTPESSAAPSPPRSPRFPLTQMAPRCSSSPWRRLLPSRASPVGLPRPEGYAAFSSFTHPLRLPRQHARSQEKPRGGRGQPFARSDRYLRFLSSDEGGHRLCERLGQLKLNPPPLLHRPWALPRRVESPPLQGTLACPRTVDSWLLTVNGPLHPDRRRSTRLSGSQTGE